MNLPSVDFLRDIIGITVVLIVSFLFVGSIKWIDENV